MTTERFTLTLEGLAQEEGHIPFKTFMQELQTVTAAWFRADRLESGSGKASFRLRIIDITHNSPLAVVMEAVPAEGETSFAAPAAKRMLRVVDALANNKVLEGEDPSLIRRSRAILTPIGRGIRSAQLQIAGTSVLLSLDRGKVAPMQAPIEEERFPGYLTGDLEAINIHAGANMFTIYPVLGTPRVRCHFPPHLTDQAKAALGSYVQVNGFLRQYPNAPFPNSIEVETLDVYPQEVDTPDLQDLFGIVPNLTDGLPSELFVRLVRNGPQS